MRFSIYSEMQHWGGKSPERQYAETAEQILLADRVMPHLQASTDRAKEPVAL